MKKLLPLLLSVYCGIPVGSSGQPIHATLTAPGILHITNDSIPNNYTNITLEWQFLVNGLTRQKGIIPGLQLPPGHPRTVRLPLGTPAPGEEAILKIVWRNGPRTRPPLAGQTLRFKPWGGDIRVPVAGELSYSDSGDAFTISSPSLLLSFDKETGWIRRYEVDHYPLLTDTNGLRPTLPSPPHLQLFSTSTGSRMVIVHTEYTLPDLSCLLHLSYTVNAAGDLLVEQTLETDTTRGDTLLHPIDHFGMNWMLQPGFDSTSWYGPAPEDPADTPPSIHLSSLSAATPAKNVRWWNIRDPEGKGFRLTADSNFLHQLSIAPPEGITPPGAAAPPGAITPPGAAAPPASIDTPGNVLKIDGDLTHPPALPLHYHVAFKITPLTSIKNPHVR
ncbi:hypothetical protein [Puia sp.]|jgi:hypothetical protein|uniref:hypothetical protein n=1 Tax=Puia sp. TaxID=2045100 RepID=UPI002F42B0B6